MAPPRSPETAIVIVKVWRGRQLIATRRVANDLSVREVLGRLGIGEHLRVCWHPEGRPDQVTTIQHGSWDDG
jgi:hypothetical protein